MPASLELVKIALQAYGNGDCEIALALAGPLIRWDERASRADGDLVWGHDEVQKAMRRYLDSWEVYRFDVEDLAEVGSGKVVGICRERGKPKEGVAVDRRFGGLWVVEDSKIASWATYLAPREAVRAAKELVGAQFDPEHVKLATGPAPETNSGPAPDAKPQPETELQLEEDSAPPDSTAAERPKRKVLTKSEEQKRAAKARARLRRRSSRQTA